MNDTSGTQKLINALSGLLRDALSGDRDGAYKERAMFFSFAGLGGLQLSRAEAVKMEEASDVLAQAFPRVARKSIVAQLQKFCCQFIPEMEAASTALPIPQKVPALLKILESLQSQTTTAYVQVAGIDLKVHEWVFGPAKFMKGNHPEIEAQRVQIVALDGSVPEPLNPDSVVIQMTLEGEPDYAEQEAVERAQEILDCIQFLSLQENHGSWYADTDIMRFNLICCGPVPLISCMVWSFGSTGPRWNYSQRSPPIPVPGTGPVKCNIEAGATERFAKRGGEELAQMLAEMAPSSFDQGLLTAMAWMANGIRERDFARKYLSFHIALEALFGRDKKGLREAKGFQKSIVPIEEGVALVLGRTVEARRQIEKRIRELADTRNRIVHRGFTAIDRSDLISLGTYSWSCCHQAALRREFFKAEDSFSTWLSALKYGNPDISWPDVRGDFVI